MMRSFIQFYCMKFFLLPCCFLWASAACLGQAVVDSVGHGVVVSPAFLAQVEHRTAQVDRSLTEHSVRYLRKMEQTEARLLKQLQRSDTLAASRLPGAAYGQLLARLKDTAAVGGRVPYLPYMDTLRTSLVFLQSQVGGTSGSVRQLSAALGQVTQLNTHLAESEAIEQYVQQRKGELTQLLSQYSKLPPGVAGSFRDLQKQGYYYKQQVQEYKDMLKDRDKLEAKTLEVLRKLPAYGDFMQKNSMLASLFALPASSEASAVAQGLQTRSQLQQEIAGRIAGGGPGAQQFAEQQVQLAQSELGKVKDNLAKYGSSGGEVTIPDFKPNNQKTKSFLRRLEYGVNVQFAKSTTFFPTTGDLGFSVGYKLNDKSTVGVGLSYKIGFGRGWSDMGLSSEGIGFRSFMDWKIKGTFYVAGGYEWNHLAFGSIAALKDKSGWQQSGLIGVEKKYRINNKVKGNMQLLFDILYRQQAPPGQLVKFRVGYNF